MVAIGSFEPGGFERIFSLLVQFSVVLGFQFFLFLKLNLPKYIGSYIHVPACYRFGKPTD